MTTDTSSSVLVLRCYAPQFIASAFERMRKHSFRDKRDELGHRIGLVEVSMRWLTAVYAAELVGLGVDPPRRYRDLLCKHFGAPSLGNWSQALQSLGKALAEHEPDELVAPALVEPFRGDPDDPLRLDQVIKGFVEARNERVGHRIGVQIPPTTDAEAVLETMREPFRELCSQLRILKSAPLYYIHDRKFDLQEALEVYRFSGPDPQTLPVVETEDRVGIAHRVPFLLGENGDVLQLQPWVKIQQSPASGRYLAMLWYGWSDKDKTVVYADPDGNNVAHAHDADRRRLATLTGTADVAKLKPESLLHVDRKRVRRDAAAPPGFWRLLGEPSSSTVGDLPQIPGYRLDGTLLGRGAAGAVYLGFQKDANQGERRCAIKVLHEDAATSPDFVERFRREARILRKMKHPNIVEVIDDGLDPIPYLVMKYRQGGDLASLRQVREFCDEEIGLIAIGLLSALAYAHHREVIHRDIKPSNVLSPRKGEAILLDWGIASSAHYLDHHLTRSYEMLGTVLFSAPEQIELIPDAITPAVDIYAVGRLLEYLATGATAGPDDVVAGMSPGMEAVVRGATHRDPRNRFPSAEAMLAAVQERQGVGWNAGAPFQEGHRVAGSYDLVVAQGEPIDGAYAFDAIEILTGREVYLVTTRVGCAAADQLVDVACQVSPGPRVFQASSLICCVSADDGRDALRAAMTDLPAAAGSDATMVAMVALGSALLPGLGGVVAGAALAAWKRYKTTLTRDSFWSPPSDIPPVPIHLEALQAHRDAAIPAVLPAVECARRAMLVMVVQLRSLNARPMDWDAWVETYEASFGLVGLLLRSEYTYDEDAGPGRLDGKAFRGSLQAVAELRNAAAHGTLDSHTEDWLKQRAAKMEPLLQMLVELGACLENRIPVGTLSPVIDTSGDAVGVRVPTGSRITHLSLDETNSMRSLTPGESKEIHEVQ